jgi:hypothetical protein
MAQRRIDRNAWEIAIYDDQRKLSYTMEFKVHEAKDDYSFETSMFSLHSDQIDMLKAFASALQQMEIMPESATTAELKATKAHLEDMRTLVLKRPLA